MKADRWGVRSLAESLLTFGEALCSAKFAVYSVLAYFPADTQLYWRPASCTVVFLQVRIRTATSRTQAWWKTSGAGRTGAWLVGATCTQSYLSCWTSSLRLGTSGKVQT